MLEEELKYFEIANDLNKAHQSSLLKEQLHFRGNGKSFSIVSISQKTPECGKSRLKFKEEGKRYVERPDEIGLTPPGRICEEKNLQAYIINHSLNNEGILPFGDFTFITSEMAVMLNMKEKIVNDILAIDSNNRLAIIELKSKRDNNVKQQAIDFEEKVIIPKRLLIEKLVEKITGKILIGKTRKIAVWPAPTSKPSEQSKYLSDKVELYNYVFEGERTKKYIIMDKVTFAKE